MHLLTIAQLPSTSHQNMNGGSTTPRKRRHTSTHEMILINSIEEKPQQ